MAKLSGAMILLALLVAGVAAKQAVLKKGRFPSTLYASTIDCLLYC